MTSRQWLRENRARIDAEIIRQCPNVRRPITDADRKLWVDNDWGLYCARRDDLRQDKGGTFWCKRH
jgi:hypothetical protein